MLDTTSLREDIEYKVGDKEMEEYINRAVEIASSADMMILAITGALIALMPIIKWTKNKTDDKYAEKALSYLKKATGFLSSFKKTKTK